MVCPQCNSTETEYLGRLSTLDWYRCRACGWKIAEHASEGFCYMCGADCTDAQLIDGVCDNCNDPGAEADWAEILYGPER